MQMKDYSKEKEYLLMLICYRETTYWLPDYEVILGR